MVAQNNKAMIYDAIDFLFGPMRAGETKTQFAIRCAWSGLIVTMAVSIGLAIVVCGMVL